MESSSFNLPLVKRLLLKIEATLQSVQERVSVFNSLDDFLTSPQGMLVLDAVSMQLIAIGETLKSIDKLTRKQLFPNYTNIPWSKVKGMRDILAHHYFEIEADEVWWVLQHEIQPLQQTIKQIISDLKDDKFL